MADPGSDFDVDQAAGIIVVHDRTTGVVTVVDDSVERVANPAGVRVGQDVAVHAVDGGALIVDQSSMSVWKLTREQLLSVASTDEVEALVTGEGGGRVGGDARRPRRARRRGGRQRRVPRPRRRPPTSAPTST